MTQSSPTIPKSNLEISSDDEVESILSNFDDELHDAATAAADKDWDIVKEVVEQAIADLQEVLAYINAKQ